VNDVVQPLPRRRWWKVFLVALAAVVLLIVLAAGALIARVAWQVRQYENLTDTHDLKARIDALAEPYIAQRPQVGLAIGVYQRGSRWFKGFGRRSADDPQAPGEETIFEIGSVTKVFTGVSLAHLVEQQSMHLGDSLSKHLPEDVKIVDALGPITLLQLATHTSGLPRLPDNLDPQNESDPYADYTAEDLYAALATTELDSPPGKTSSYSNFGMGLLGHVLSLHRQTGYESLVREVICQPLEMSDTVMTLSAEQQSRLTPGHDPKGKVVPNWNFDVLAPAGAFRSTARDLLTFVEANLAERDDALGGALKLARKKHHEHWSGDVGLAWQIKNSPEGLVQHWHNGGTGGYVSFVGFDHKHQIGVVLLSNYGDAFAGDDAVDRMGMEILKLATKVSLE
jgi:serine-type D-Ala-D-Ala carboxypeptidase/endopeptidase